MRKEISIDRPMRSSMRGNAYMQFVKKKQRTGSTGGNQEACIRTNILAAIRNASLRVDGMLRAMG